MSIPPDEQKELERIGSELRAGAPTLASMYGIFTRLTAGEGRPPEEDRIVAAARPPRRVRSRAGKLSHRAGNGPPAVPPVSPPQPLALVLLATLLVMVLVVSLAGIR